MELPVTATGKQPVISVSLSNTDESQLKDFRCVVCGHVVFRYYNDVRVIFPGEAEFRHSPIQVQCHGSVIKHTPQGDVTSKCRAIYFLG